VQLAVVIATLAAVAVLAWTVSVRTGLLTVSQFFAARPKSSSSLGVTLTPQASALHQQLRVADLHCDALLWNRDLTRRSRWGDLDFPRMTEGNCAVQLFLSVTELPRQTVGDNLTDKSNRLTLLGVLEQWPMAAILDQTERALHLAGKLKRYCARTGGNVRFIETASQLSRALDDRITDPRIRAAVLGLESSDGTKYSLKNIERLFAAGYRTSELCHFTDTPFAAAASGVSKGGLTPLGREAVAVMDELGMIVDLAHAAPRVIEDVLACSKRPAFISHTGARSVHDDPKCQSDELLRAVVDKGGVVGLCFVEDYIGGTRLDDIRQSLEHVLGAVGQDGIVLGSGFDSLPVPISVDQLPYLTQALLSAGLDAAAIKAVMGENAIRFLLRELPQDRPSRT
jgi:membrane dipeptidase